MGVIPTSFSPVTSTNVETSPKKFMTFSSNPFATFLNLNQEHPSKNCFFWLNPYEIEVMKTYLRETLQLPNVNDHMTTSTI